MTRIASHRGGALEYGDSTYAGFSATAQLPLEEVEFDLHPTVDGAIMVHHDSTLDRTTDRSGAIATLTTAEVRGAIVNHCHGGPAHTLDLDELCAVFADSSVEFRCEIKPGADGRPYRDFVPRVIETLERNGRLQKTHFSSFLLDTLKELGEATDRPRLWLVSPPVLQQIGADGIIALSCASGLPEIGVHIDCADAQLMKRVQHAGLAFGCWAAHATPQIEKALDLGVKVFTTDRPNLAIAIRQRHRAAAAWLSEEFPA